MPLSTIRTGHDPGDWSRVSDRQAAVALTEYEAGICGDCGQPKARSFSQDMSGWYDVAEVECHGCAAIAEHVASQAGEERRPHVKLALVDTYDEAQLGSLRPFGGLTSVHEHDGFDPLPPPTPDLLDDDSLGGET